MDIGALAMAERTICRTISYWQCCLWPRHRSLYCSLSQKKRSMDTGLCRMSANSRGNLLARPRNAVHNDQEAYRAGFNLGAFRCSRGQTQDPQADCVRKTSPYRGVSSTGSALESRPEQRCGSIRRSKNESCRSNTLLPLQLAPYVSKRRPDRSLRG